ncbi:ABC transporter ATP-binding protein [Vibrio owensii]|uniref:ATP-binding cassette domain-containing protein n=1 Tax=Vibrio harveyi group TaxID=717610 RepID=UPI003CC5FF23
MLSRFSVLSSHPEFSFMRKSYAKGANEISVDLAPGVNIIAGKNGAGKTTFFNILKDRLMKGLAQEHVSFDLDPDFDPSTVQPCYFFTMNEMGAQEQLRNTYPTQLDKIAYHLECAELSSGQQMFEVLERVLDLKDSSTMICIDEPEISLDSTHIIKLIKALEAIAKCGVQVVVVSHHPMLVLNKSFNIVPLDGTPDYVAEMRKNLMKYIK